MNISFSEFKSYLEQLKDANHAHAGLHRDLTKHFENISRKDCSFQLFADAIAFVKTLPNEPDAILLQDFDIRDFLPVTATDLASSKRVHATLEYCKEYQEHLLKQVRAESDDIAPGKLQIITACIQALEEPGKTADEQLADFKVIFDDADNRKTLNTRRDNAGITFLKGVLTVLSLGIAWAAGLWSTKGGKMSENIDELENFKHVAPQL